MQSEIKYSNNHKMSVTCKICHHIQYRSEHTVGKLDFSQHFDGHVKYEAAL